MQLAEDYLASFRVLDGQLLAYGLRPSECRLNCIFVSFLGDDWYSDEQRSNDANWNTKEVEIQLRNICGLKVSFDYPGPAKLPCEPAIGEIDLIDASGPRNEARFRMQLNRGEIEVEKCNFNIAIVRSPAVFS